MLLEDLPACQEALPGEVLELVDRRELMGRGIGYVDAHLLAAVMLTPSARLFTRDKRLARVANELGVGASS